MMAFFPKSNYINPQYDDKLIQSGSDLTKHFNKAYWARCVEENNSFVRYGNKVVLNIGVENLAGEL
jgi:hypothetical protein